MQAAAAQARDAQARETVNSPPNLLSMGVDLAKKLVGNFESLYGLPALQGPDTDDLTIDNAVTQMAPDAPQSTRDALKSDLLQADPTTRANMLAAYLPYATVDPNTGDIKSVDTAALTDAIGRKADPAFQASKAKTRSDFQAQVRSNLAGDPRLQGTSVGNIISQVASLPAYASAANPVIAPFGLPLIFGRIFSDSRQTLADQHPDWSDEQLDQGAANSAIIQTVGAEAGGRIIGAGLGPLLRNVRGGYLARAAVQVPVTGLAQAGVGAGTQALTNIATGESPGQGIVEAALGQGLVGAIAGGIHAAAPPEVRPPLARPEDVTTGAKGAPIRGPEEGTLEQGQAQAEQPPQPPPPPPPAVQTAPVPEAPPAPEAPASEAPAPEVPAVPEREPPSQVEQPPKAPEVPEVPEAAAEVPAQPQPVTQEDVARRTYEIGQERERTGQPGNGVSDHLQAQQELAQATEPLPPTNGESEPWVSSIANRFTQERTAAGTLGEVAPGEGASTEALLARGLRMGPEQINQHVSDIMNNRGGDPVAQASAIRAEEARLSQRSAAASRAAEADPSNPQLRAAANDAFADVTDFHNGPVAKLKNNWHAQGMGLQGELPVDLATTNGLREAFLRDNGKAPPPQMDSAIRDMAGKVSDAAAANNGAMQALSTEIAKQTTRRRLPTADDVRSRIMEKIKDMPCPT
jgi:hypothetical protein